MSVAGSIELQVISKLITTQDRTEIQRLCEYGEEYYSLLAPQIKFILDHVEKYGDTPDAFTFQAEFPTITLIPVSEPIDYLCKELQRNRERILLLETFNKVKTLGVDDAAAAWEYIGLQYEMYQQLGSSQPFDIIHQAQERSRQVVEWSKQSRIPTGFKEVDEIMYGGLSTVEEMLVIISRTGNGKTWMASKMAESAQGHGFPDSIETGNILGVVMAGKSKSWVPMAIAVAMALAIVLLSFADMATDYPLWRIRGVIVFVLFVAGVVSVVRTKKWPWLFVMLFLLLLEGAIMDHV